MTIASQRVGQPVNRVDGVAKVTGNAHYTADVELPGQVHAVLVQSELPRGRVTEASLRSSAERAGQAPGVRYVLTPLNCPPLHTLPRELTYDLPLERRPPLSDLTVQQWVNTWPWWSPTPWSTPSMPHPCSSSNTRLLRRC